MSKRYWVEVTRISYSRQTLQVHAESRSQAQDFALKRASEEGFSTYDSEYEISSAEPPAAESNLLDA